MTSPDTSSDTARRVLDALAVVIADKGYGATTIADLAAAARVSKRSFYEHFDDKADALIALYESATRQSFAVLQGAIDPARDWHVQLDAALAAYLGTLAANPPLLRTLFIEIMALGPRGLAARRRATEAFADFIVQVVGPALPRPLAVAIVGGIHEWVLQAVEADAVATLPALCGPASQLVLAVVDAVPAKAARARNASSRQVVTATK
jgi:AcrR family transcriptional regulator